MRFVRSEVLLAESSTIHQRDFTYPVASSAQQAFSSLVLVGSRPDGHGLELDIVDLPGIATGEAADDLQLGQM